MQFICDSSRLFFFSRTSALTLVTMLSTGMVIIGYDFIVEEIGISEDLEFVITVSFVPSSSLARYMYYSYMRRVLNNLR